MQFGPDENQQALCQALRGLLPTVTPDQPAVDNDTLWKRLAQEIGVQGIAVPEYLGGAGGSIVDLVFAFTETGRALTGGSLLPTVGFATNLLLACEQGDRRDDLVRQLADGTLRAAAVTNPDAADLGVTHGEDGTTLDGRTGPVLGGAKADIVLIPVAGALLVIDSNAPSVTTRVCETPDLTVDMAELSFELANVEQFALERGDGVHLGRLCLAAEQVGAARAILEMTVEYANLRNQFGRPIGSFQAVKHRCADALVAVEGAEASLLVSAAAFRDGDGDPVDALSATLACGDALALASRSSIQVHGAIGFTWEHRAHLYLRRALSSNYLFGAPSRGYQDVAAELFDTSETR